MKLGVYIRFYVYQVNGCLNKILPLFLASIIIDFQNDNKYNSKQFRGVLGFWGFGVLGLGFLGFLRFLGFRA